MSDIILFENHEYLFYLSHLGSGRCVNEKCDIFAVITCKFIWKAENDEIFNYLFHLLVH